MYIHRKSKYCVSYPRKQYMTKTRYVGWRPYLRRRFNARMEIAMVKKKKVTLPHIILYVLFLFAYYTVTKDWSMSVAHSIFAEVMNHIPRPILAVFVSLIYILVDLLLPVLVIGILFFFFVPEQYHKKNHWRKCLLKFVLPGEIIRFFISLVCLGHNKQFGGRFCNAPAFLFENTYMVASNRYDAIRNDLMYIPTDFFVFALCYLLYAVIYGILIALLYRFLWQRERSNRGDDRIIQAPTENTEEKV